MLHDIIPIIMKKMFKNNGIKIIIIFVCLALFFYGKIEFSEIKVRNSANVQQSLELIPLNSINPAITQTLNLEPIREITPAVTQTLKLEPIKTASDSLKPQELPWGEKIQHQGVPFGGLVIERIPCDCEDPTGKYKYTVIMNEYVEKTTKKFKIDIPYTKFYLFYELNVGQYGLGTYDPGGKCYTKKVDPECKVPLIVDGVINHGPGVGSSGIMGSGLSFPSTLGSGATNFMEGGSFPAIFNF